MSGPLSGLKVLEFAGLGPAPFCGMLLADLGADVVRIDRRGAAGAPSIAEGMRVLGRGRRSIELDLKAAADVETALALAGKADALIEGFRPGVMERLGLGPDAVLARNPKIAYGRMTGWGQDGPLARTAGHDIDYIALTGALHAIGLEDKPVAPLNLIGDFGGGGAYQAFGVVSAMLHAQRTGEGQVVDCAMTDGAASLMAMIYGMHGEGLWSDQRRTNFVDGGTPYYDTYQCADGGWVAVGALEPQFFAQLLRLTGLAGDPAFSDQTNREQWPAMREALTRVFRSKTRDAWCAVFAGADACLAPVLTLAEAPHHPHNRARRTFVEFDGLTQPAPAPRFSRTPGAIRRPAPDFGADGAEVLADWLSTAPSGDDA